MKIIHAAIPIFVGMGLATLPVSARTTPPIYGGSGGGHTMEECSPGHYMVGVRVRTGSWMDQLAVGCARLLPNQTFAPPDYLPARGGGGGSARVAYTCNADEVVTSILPSFTRDGSRFRYLADLIISCSSVRTWQRRDIVISTASRNVGRVDGNPRHVCPKGEVAKGVQLRSGAFIDAIGLICDSYQEPAAPPPPVATAPAQPQQAGGGTTKSLSTTEAMDCRGGGGMAVTPNADGKFVRISFAHGGNVNRLRAGECAWVNRPFRPQEGRQLSLNLSADRAQEVLDAARNGGTFTVRGNPFGGLIAVASVANVRGGGTQASPAPAPAPGPMPGGGSASGSCPGGIATVVIAQQHLDRLNVRNGSNGDVIGAVPRGGRVSVVGPCGTAGSAGLRGGARPTVNASGWCQIQAPVAGCVMSEFLQFGGGGGGAPDGSAGLRRRR
jgi:hypothetical protein